MAPACLNIREHFGRLKSIFVYQLSGSSAHRVKRMFNTIFAKNFYQKGVFQQETDVRLWSI
jgi:hypothetical protein